MFRSIVLRCLPAASLLGIVIGAAASIGRAQAPGSKLVVPLLAQSRAVGGAGPIADPTAAAQLRLVQPQGTSPAAQPVVPNAAAPNGAAPADDRRLRVADPTLPGPEMRELLNQNRTQAQSPAVRPRGSALPEIKLKARVIAAGKPAAAVLEIGGTSLTVREGTDITLGDPNDAATALQLKVAELSSTAVRLESSSPRKLTLTLN